MRNKKRYIKRRKKIYKKKRKKKFKNRIIMLGILLISVILSFKGIWYIKEKSTEKEVVILESGENSQVNTLKSIENSEINFSESTPSKSEKIEELINTKYLEYKDKLSIFYYNLESCDEYALNEDEYFYAASTSKVPQAMMILDAAFKGIISLDDVLIYEDEDYEEGTGSLQYNDITALTIEEAIYLSITESDNIAKNMLGKVLDTEIYEYIQEISWNYELEEGNYLTARDLYLVLKKLYVNEEQNPYYHYLIEIMKKTIFNSRLDRYIHSSLVAHKIGSYNRYYHDIGIIYGDEPYVLVVLTKDIGELAEGEFEDERDRYVLDWGELAEEVIGDISKDIYDIVEGE